MLAVTKQTAQDVSDKLANASETNKKINEACEEYRPVAHRATLLYFLVAEFAVVSCMYQTSLRQFVELYERSIDAAERAAMPSKRIANIIEHLTYEIYLYTQVCAARLGAGGRRLGAAALLGAMHAHCMACVSDEVAHGFCIWRAHCQQTWQALSWRVRQAPPPCVTCAHACRPACCVRVSLPAARPV